MFQVRVLSSGSGFARVPNPGSRVPRLRLTETNAIMCSVQFRTFVVAIIVLAFVTGTGGQDLTQATPLTMVSREGRRPIPTTVQGGREVVALDDVAALFRVTVREDTLAGGVTVS